MTAITWDEVGTRVYEAGVDRGVLYLPDGGGVPWSGLISVSEKPPSSAGTPVYFDGMKYGESLALGDFSAALRAYTYPDEFLEFEGVADAGNGMYLANQRPLRFGLSYRTKVGNDTEGDEAGYKIHVIYNLTAIPSQKMYSTRPDGSVSSFEWTVSAIPEVVPGFRPTAHVIFDTRKMTDLLISDIERTLYGDEITEPRLPAISTLVAFISDWVVIRITDNNDGTWTAEGPDDLITMLDATSFQIIQANAVYLDADTYVISDTTN